jgi:hypothetical protein
MNLIKFIKLIFLNSLNFFNKIKKTYDNIDIFGYIVNVLYFSVIVKNFNKQILKFYKKNPRIYSIKSVNKYHSKLFSLVDTRKYKHLNRMRFFISSNDEEKLPTSFVETINYLNEKRKNADPNIFINSAKQNVLKKRLEE